MTVSEFWEDDCPLLQEIVGEEWQVYKQHLIKNHSERWHEDKKGYMCGMNAKNPLHGKRADLSQKLRDFYMKAIENVSVTMPFESYEKRFRGSLGPRMSAYQELPMIDGPENSEFAFYALIEDGSEQPEEIIKICSDLIRTRDFLAGKGYKPEYELNSFKTVKLQYEVPLNPNSITDLRTFLGDLKELYELFEEEK